MREVGDIRYGDNFEDGWTVDKSNEEVGRTRDRRKASLGGSKLGKKQAPVR